MLCSGLIFVIDVEIYSEPDSTSYSVKLIDAMTNAA
jgi:hypothetical protein